MQKITLLIVLCFSLLNSGCKKKSYDWNVHYKLTVTPNTSPVAYATDISYTVKDGVTKTETINALQWEYSFQGKEDDFASISAVNVSNAAAVKIEIILNNNPISSTKSCTTGGCDVSISKQLQ